jgi:hypothetical protein
VTVPIASLALFACIAKEKKMGGLMSYLLTLENKVLANTDWFDTGNKYVAVLLPNFFILYFGQNHLPGT